MGSEEIANQDRLSLKDSHICRLCAEENANGYPLFEHSENGEQDLSALINMYLPLKIIDDGKYPRWICPGCRLQVESTVEFFNLVVYGQEMLRICYDTQCKLDKASENMLVTLDPNVDDSRVLISTAGSVENLSFHVDLVEKMSLTTTADPTCDENSEKPKRKRGRPPKPPASTEPKADTPVENTQEEVAEVCTDSTDETIVAGRRRRQIKIPSRFQEAVQGKELEKIYMESGIIESETYIGSDVEEGVEITASGESSSVYPVEVIGHLKDNDGWNLGDLVVVNNKLQKTTKKSKKKTRFMCDICKVFFCYEQKFLQHRATHYKVRFECIECAESFMQRNSLAQHQTETGHQGEGIIEGFPIIVEDPPIDENQEQLTNQSYNVDGLLDNAPDSVHCDEQNNQHITDTLYENEEISCDLRASDHGEDNPISSFGVSIHFKDQLVSFDNTCVEQSINESIELGNAELKTESHNQDESLDHFYNCNICHREFTCRQSFLYHKESEHNDGRRFVCSKCSKSFKNKILLQRHQLVHSNVRPFACDICGASFKTKTHMIYHKVSHTGEKKYHCAVCQQSFLYKNSLTLHMRSHTGQKPFKCSVCEKTFSQHGNMQEHMRIHTGECPFECPICERKFKTSSQVRMHIKRHEAVKPLKCNICDKAFVQIVELRNHQRRHRNDKPYSCVECGKGFIDSNALKKHFRLHTGERPHSCTECPRRFADRSNLKKHLKIHENKRAQFISAKSSNLINGTDDQTMDDYTQSSALSCDNFILASTDVNGIVGDNPMWDLVEEDVRLDDDKTTAMSIVDTTTSGQQLVNITFQDPDDPLRSKTTLFVVQNTATDPTIDKISSLQEALTIAESCSTEQMLSNSNMFLTNSETDSNARQTVILNIPNSVDFNLEEACELFRTDDDDRHDSDVHLIMNGKSKVEFLSYTDSLDIPD